MLRLEANFISKENILEEIGGHWNFGLGDPTFINKPINIFVDHTPTEYELCLNPYNFLFILEPNEYFGLHDYAIQHQDKFSAIFTWSKKILDNCENAHWFPFGVSWLDGEFIKQMETKEKTFEVSYLCGNKRKLEGHDIRHRLYNREKEIKTPKKWFYTLPDYSYEEQKILGDLSQKKVVWEDSMFSICIENTSHHGYHTEKVIDAFLSKTIPIYWGCKDIDSMYDGEGIIQCNNEDEIIEIVNKLTPDYYHSRKEAIDKNYETAKHYANIYGRIKSLIQTIIEHNGIEDNKYHGQHLEDMWIDQYLELPDKGFFLDIGGCYPVWLSNTYFFEKEKGWNGLVIEPDPTYFEANTKVRKCLLEEVAIHPNEGEMSFKPMSNLTEEDEEGSIKVKCARLDKLLNKHNVKEIDLISIDIEGYEEEAWTTFDYKKYNPKVMIIEHTEFGKYDDTFAKQVLEDQNYRIVHTTPLNYIIARKDIKIK